MRSLSVVLATTVAVVWVAPAFAESEPSAADAAAEPKMDAGADAGEAESGLSWDDFEDPGFDPAAPPGEAGTAADTPMAGTAGDTPSAADAASEDLDDPIEGEFEDVLEAELDAVLETDGEGPAQPTAAPAPRTHRVVLGPMGSDAEGRIGRLHTVAGGDTLWDISAAYLGTPWVWPSVWRDNDGIENPHVINPGDLIWITSTEMRRVTVEEAQELLEGGESIPLEEVAVNEPEDTPAELDDTEIPAGPVPVSVPLAGDTTPESGHTIRVSTRESMSFLSNDTLEAATSIVGSLSERQWLGTPDVIHIGLGEGEVEVGDQFTVFRDFETVRDLRGRLLGHHIRVLGWAEVRQVHGDTATAQIQMSTSEMKLGDRLVPREEHPVAVSVREAPIELVGHVVHLPDLRTVVGSSDYVYIDRGIVHGLEVGSALEVYDAGVVKTEEVRSTRVQTPHVPVADMVVVIAKPDSAVAFVTHARHEIEVGSLVRAAGRVIASK